MGILKSIQLTNDFLLGFKYCKVIIFYGEAIGEAIPPSIN